jgi:hypothetical protein
VRHANREAARQQQVADLYLQGMTQMEVAAKLGLCQSEVSRCLSRMRAEWKLSVVLDMSDRIAQETVKLDRLERAAHLAYVKSCLPVWRGANDMPPGLTPAKQKKWLADRMAERAAKIEELLALPLPDLIVRDEARIGENNLLKTLLSIIDRRIRLWGADAPTRTVLSGDPDNPIQVQHAGKTDSEWMSMSMAEKVRYLQDVVKARASQRQAGSATVTASEAN